MPVDSRTSAKAMGIMRLDETGRVAGFLEKPQTDKEMDMVRMDPAWIDARGIPSRGRDMLASMGIYLFNRDDAGRPADKNRLPRFRPRDLSRRRPHRIACRSTCSTAIGKTSARSDRSTSANLAMAAHNAPFHLVTGKRRSTPGRVSCPPRASRARRSATA